jgi:phosphatidylglycerophosphate synthase
MIGRDIIVDALRIHAISQKQTIAANSFGKLKTIFQMIAILVIFFILNSSNPDSSQLNYYLLQNMFMYLALITSVISGVIYFLNYSKNKQHK